MRPILLLLVLTCTPAFCQDNGPGTEFKYNPQWFPKIDLSKPHTVFKLQTENTAPAVCSIPLLNAKPAGTPVHMPELRIPHVAPGASGAAGARTEPQVFDHMAVKPPAPACPAR